MCFISSVVEHRLSVLSLLIEPLFCTRWPCVQLKDPFPQTPLRPDMTKHSGVANEIEIEVARLGFPEKFLKRQTQQACAFIIFCCDILLFSLLIEKLNQCLKCNINKDKSVTFYKWDTCIPSAPRSTNNIANTPEAPPILPPSLLPPQG